MEKNQINGFLKELSKESFSKNSRENFEAVLTLFLEKGVLSAEKGKTIRDLAEELKDKKIPRSNLQRAIKKLESLGLINRRLKGEGYFLSYSYINRAEEMKATWRKLLREAEKREEGV